MKITIILRDKDARYWYYMLSQKYNRRRSKFSESGLARMVKMAAREIVVEQAQKELKELEASFNAMAAIESEGA